MMNKKQLSEFGKILEALQEAGISCTIARPDRYTRQALLDQIAVSFRRVTDERRRAQEEARHAYAQAQAAGERELARAKELDKDRAEMATKIHEDIGKGIARALFRSESPFFYNR